MKKPLIDSKLLKITKSIVDAYHNKEPYLSSKLFPEKTKSDPIADIKKAIKAAKHPIGQHPNAVLVFDGKTRTGLIEMLERNGYTWEYKDGESLPCEILFSKKSACN